MEFRGYTERMTLDVWFWVLMLLYVLFGVWRDYDSPGPWYRWGGAHLFHVLLLRVIGWRVFGSPVK